MIELTRVFTKARKNCEARPTEYLLYKKDGSITICREGQDGVITTGASFRVGDVSEYDSYNLHYLGNIEAITEKSVSIHTGYFKDGGCRTTKGTVKDIKRLNMYEFCLRNFKFNEEEIRRKNSETSMHI